MQYTHHQYRSIQHPSARTMVSLLQLLSFTHGALRALEVLKSKGDPQALHSPTCALYDWPLGGCESFGNWIPPGSGLTCPNRSQRKKSHPLPLA